MLELRNIKKDYPAGSGVVHALRGIDLQFRKSEFVAILGPSGCGKTTMLNIIGGLDGYTDGDLIINGVSTKRFKARDWDTYRNHSVGFVFQSYNLIPHQTVLANVELALTLSGVSKTERRRRAKEALEAVGLGDQLKKKPNAMSGGQMQRVAIARALVNNPDIILADEPTGALDTETSMQVMDILKEVAKDRLVVMVTHNPELAERYASRIIRMLDGSLTDDSNPLTDEEKTAAAAEYERRKQSKHKPPKKPSMSFGTSFMLSLKNLFTKKGRTILTAFAGSIGIIGIALILSLSTGFQAYIDQIQEDTLSNYPLTIQSETADMTAALAAYGSAMAEAEEAGEGIVVEQPMISQMFAQIGSNDLGSFKTYLEENYDQVAHTINAVQYDYNVKPLIFSSDTSDGVLQVNPGTLFGAITGSSAMSSYMDTDIFQEMVDNIEMLDSQYDVLRGRWPENYDELVVVLSDASQISDYMAYTLGLKDPTALNTMIQQFMRGEEPDSTALEDPMQWTYDDLMALTFRLVPAASQYRYNEEYKVWEDMSDNEDYMRGLVQNGEELRVVGIVCPKEGVTTSTLSTGIAYTSDLTRHVIETASQTKIVAMQQQDPEIDVFTGKAFSEDSGEFELSFEDMITVDEEMISSAFGMNVSTDAIMSMLEGYIKEILASVQTDTVPAQNDFLDTLSSLATDMLNSFIASNADESGGATLYLANAETIVENYMASDSADALIQSLANEYQVSKSSLSGVYESLLLGLVTDYISTEMTVTTVVPSEEEETPAETTEPQEEGSGFDASVLSAVITSADVPSAVEKYTSSTVVTGTAAVMATQMMQTTLQTMVQQKLSGFGNRVMNYIGSSIYVDEEKIANAFQFNMTEEDLMRLMNAMSGTEQESSASANLASLGYADLDQPTMISIYMIDFAGKEEFISFLDAYNDQMEAEGKEDQVISYTDLTGIMMSSMRTIIDSVSYVLIAFVAVSLVVSSIMIGIITLISVQERTKEIGILRAIGASKRNISQVFNAETFIIGLCSGAIGVGLTLILNVPINYIIHDLTGNMAINAQLPVVGGTVLVILSMALTLIGGLIPSRQAAKKDPVIALRSE